MHYPQLLCPNQRMLNVQGRRERRGKEHQYPTPSPTIFWNKIFFVHVKP